MRRKWIVMAVLLCLSFAIIGIGITDGIARNRRHTRLQHYWEIAVSAANEFNVPCAMVLAVIRTESDFYPDVISSAGACGLMQLMPETFRFLRDEKFGDSHPDNAIFDPNVNIHYGTYYLSYLYDAFGNWFTALAAYNAGEGRVREWLKDPELSPGGRLQRIPFSETAAYVNKTMQTFAGYAKNFKGELT